MEQYDKDKNGVIDFEEFKEIVSARSPSVQHTAAQLPQTAAREPSSLIQSGGPANARLARECVITDRACAGL